MHRPQPNKKQLVSDIEEYLNLVKVILDLNHKVLEKEKIIKHKIDAKHEFTFEEGMILRKLEEDVEDLKNEISLSSLKRTEIEVDIIKNIPLRNKWIVLSQENNFRTYKIKYKNEKNEIEIANETSSYLEA